MNLPISPLSLDALTRDTWGSFDAAAICQLAPLADDLCYRPRLYKSPDSPSEVMAANGYVSHGLKITPGSLIFGFYLPAELVAPPVGSGGSLVVQAVTPPQFNVQITDTSLGHKLFDEPIPSMFLANFKPTYYSAVFVLAGSFPNLLCAPYPVVGSGLFMVELWNTAGAQQRVELVIGTLEPLPVGEEGCS
jgi:hypothetical protein